MCGILFIIFGEQYN